MRLELTSSVYSFEKLRKGNFLYADKTEFIWKMIEPYSAMFFLARPRRFGKSLTVSTLKAVFEGRRELFEGLAISRKPYDWKKYPVLHLDMGNCDAHTPEDLRGYLENLMKNLAEINHVEIRIDRRQLAASFASLIRKVAEKEHAVILLDEYDKPILENISSPQTEEIRTVLADFYSSIKTESEHLRFVFVTGVSKFCQVSLFSKLNNLTDITMDSRFATMFGYTQAELENYFEDRIHEVAAARHMPESQLKRKLKEWYDGFCFAANAESVYNPVSIARFFERGGEFDNYWFSTGTPSFLMELAKKMDFDFERVFDSPVSADAFSAYEIDKIDPLVLLVQTGYLTIKSSEEDFGMRLYKLGFPNQEVAFSFKTYLLNAYTPYTSEQINFSVMSLARSIRSGDVDAFMNVWKAWMAKIPYDIQLRHEKYYQTIFYMMFMSLQGIINEAECRTNSGRIDAVVGCGEWLYIVEFKLDKSPEVALEQIRKNEYSARFRDCGKRIVLIGANVDFENRTLTGWKHKEV